MEELPEAERRQLPYLAQSPYQDDATHSHSVHTAAQLAQQQILNLCTLRWRPQVQQLMANRQLAVTVSGSARIMPTDHGLWQSAMLIQHNLIAIRIFQDDMGRTTTVFVCLLL